jgi:hypothetical protein
MDALKATQPSMANKRSINVSKPKLAHSAALTPPAFLLLQMLAAVMPSLL